MVNIYEKYTALGTDKHLYHALMKLLTTNLKGNFTIDSVLSNCKKALKKPEKNLEAFFIYAPLLADFSRELELVVEQASIQGPKEQSYLTDSINELKEKKPDYPFQGYHKFAHDANSFAVSVFKGDISSAKSNFEQIESFFENKKELKKIKIIDKTDNIEKNYLEDFYLKIIVEQIKLFDYAPDIVIPVDIMRLGYLFGSAMDCDVMPLSTVKRTTLSVYNGDVKILLSDQNKIDGIKNKKILLYFSESRNGKEVQDIKAYLEKYSPLDVMVAVSLVYSKTKIKDIHFFNNYDEQSVAIPNFHENRTKSIKDYKKFRHMMYLAGIYDDSEIYHDLLSPEKWKDFISKIKQDIDGLETFSGQDLYQKRIGILKNPKDIIIDICYMEKQGQFLHQNDEGKLEIIKPSADWKFYTRKGLDWDDLINMLEFN